MKKIFLFLIYFIIPFFTFTQEIISSSTGSIYITNDDYLIIICLVDNYNEVIKEWDDTDINKIPGVPAKIIFKQGGNCVPFITFSIINENKLENNIYYNIRLVKPKGVISQNKMEKLKLKVNKVKQGLFYNAYQMYGWSFDNTDPKGEYKIIIEIYDTDNFKKTVELTFNLS